MSKLKAGICFLCKKPLQRHDEKRLKVRTGRAFKEVHLSCFQDNQSRFKEE